MKNHTRYASCNPRTPTAQGSKIIYTPLKPQPPPLTQAVDRQEHPHCKPQDRAAWARRRRFLQQHGVVVASNEVRS